MPAKGARSSVLRTNPVSAGPAKMRCHRQVRALAGRRQVAGRLLDLPQIRWRTASRISCRITSWVTGDTYGAAGPICSRGPGGRQLARRSVTAATSGGTAQIADYERLARWHGIQLWAHRSSLIWAESPLAAELPAGGYGSALLIKYAARGLFADRTPDPTATGPTPGMAAGPGGG